jgi:hypothetical protein
MPDAAGATVKLVARCRSGPTAPATHGERCNGARNASGHAESVRHRFALRHVGGPRLPVNLSRHEIAAELSVPVNTVSTHICSIYAKPQVSDRSSAVQHARELRLLAVALQESRTANYRAQVTAAHLDGRYLERTRLLSREGALAPDPLAPGDPLLLLTAAVSRGQDHQDRRCPRSDRVNHRDLVAPPNLPGGNPGSGPPPGRRFSEAD